MLPSQIRVLIVEDLESWRRRLEKITKEQFDELGIKHSKDSIRVVSTRREAIDLLEDDEVLWHLLITDFVLKETSDSSIEEAKENGRDVIEFAAEHKKEMQIIVVSEKASGADGAEFVGRFKIPYNRVIDKASHFSKLLAHEVLDVLRAVVEDSGDETPARSRMPLTLSDNSQFDVFLAHNSLDKPQVKAIAEKIKQRDLKPWLDDEQIPPGCSFQDKIQEAIPLVKSAAIFISVNGLGAWQAWEVRALMSQCAQNHIRLIPVLLPGVKNVPEHLRFLAEFRWVRFSKGIDDENALELLQWGITGQKPERIPQNEMPGQIPTEEFL